MATAMKSKKPEKNLAGVKSDRFKIVELGLYDAAEKWLKRHGIDSRDLFLWVGQLDTEETEIQFADWSKRVDAARRTYRPKAKKPKPANQLPLTADGKPDFCSLHRKPDKPAAMTVDVVSTPAEKLTTDERRELATHEKSIARSAHAFLDLGNALAEIQEKRLYRASHATFEAYLTERWKLERSVAYRCIAAVKIKRQISPIADTLKIELTNESQFRPLAKIAPGDTVTLKKVLQSAARKTSADPDGKNRPTAKILTEAVRSQLGSEDHTPEDLKRHAAELRAAKRPAPKMPREDPDPRQGMFSKGVQVHGEIPDSWKDLLASPAPPKDGSDPGYWNGRPNPCAAELRGLAQIIDQLVARHLGQGDAQFRDDLASLLRSRSLDLALAPPVTARRPK